jgi:hypothetical protein
MLASSQTLGVVDAIGAVAIFSVLPTVANPLTKLALAGFGAYAAYGAYKHLTGGLEVHLLR